MGAMRVVIGVLCIAALCAPAATAQDLKSGKAVVDKR
jgi:hypothetical protein